MVRSLRAEFDLAETLTGISGCLCDRIPEQLRGHEV